MRHGRTGHTFPLMVARGHFAIAFMGCATLATPAAAASPVVLTPSSKWVVDYANEKCRLMRSFGTGDQTAMLMFVQSAPSGGFGLTAAGPSLRGFVDSRPVVLRVNDTLAEMRGRPFTGKVDGVGPALIYSTLAFGAEEMRRAESEEPVPMAGLPEIDLVRAAEAEYVEFGQGNRKVRFATGNMRAPMAALNSCTADLVRSWGLDLERHRSATRLPVWTNREAVVRKIVAQYPAQAVQVGEQAIIEMRVMIDSAGAVSSCHIERTTSADALNSPACKEMARARFEPALDAQGQAMPSYYATTVVYKMGR